jgi:hypothetical protein
MKVIDILFIVNMDFYDYTQDELIFIKDITSNSKYHINLIYSNFDNYTQYTQKSYFNFEYIFIFTNDYFGNLTYIINILNKHYSNSKVYILCNDNYIKLKCKYQILGVNNVIFFYFKFKNKNLSNKYIDNNFLNGSWYN